jgi:hypothetical protein
MLKSGIVKKVTAFVGTARKQSHLLCCSSVPELPPLDRRRRIRGSSPYLTINWRCAEAARPASAGRGVLPAEGRPGRAHQEDDDVGRSGLRVPELLIPGLSDHEDIPRQARLYIPPTALLRQDLYQHCSPGYLRRVEDREVPGLRGHGPWFRRGQRKLYHRTRSDE